MLTLLLLLPALQAPIVLDPLGQLLTYGTAFASTALLGLTKKYTTVFDTKIGQAIKPVQPWLVLLLSAALPRLIHGATAPDAGQLVAAPTSTLLAVGVAELTRRLFPSKA